MRCPLQTSQKTQLQPPLGPWVGSLCHPCITTTHLFYSVLTSATALCGTTGNVSKDIYISGKEMGPGPSHHSHPGCSRPMPLSNCVSNCVSSGFSCRVVQRYGGLGFFGNVGFISFPRCVSLMLAAACLLIITQEMLVLPSYSISTTVVRRKAAAMLLWFVYSCALLQGNVTPFAVSTCQASRVFVLGP